MRTLKQSYLSFKAWLSYQLRRPVDTQSQVERLRLMFGALQNGVIALVVAGTIAFGYVATTPRFAVALIWLPLFLALHGYAWYGFRQFRALQSSNALFAGQAGTKTALEIASWQRRHSLIFFLLGMPWALLFIGLSPLDLELRYLILMLSLGLMLGAVLLSALLVRSLLLFCAPIYGACAYLCLVAPALRVGAAVQRGSYVLVLVCMAGFALLLFVVYRRLMVRYIRSRLINSRLVGELMSALEDPGASVLRIVGNEVVYATEALALALGRSTTALCKLRLEVILGAGPLSDPTWLRLKAAMRFGTPLSLTCDMPRAGGGLVRMLMKVREVADGRNMMGSVLLFAEVKDPFSWLEQTDKRTPGVNPMAYTDGPQWMAHAERQRSQAEAIEARSAIVTLSSHMSSKAENERFMLAVSDALCVRLSRGDAIYVTNDHLYIWLNTLLPGLSLVEIRASLGQCLSKRLSFSDCAQSKANIGIAELPGSAKTPKDALVTAHANTRRLFAF